MQRGKNRNYKTFKARDNDDTDYGVVVGTEKSKQLYFEGRTLRTFERTDVEGDWKGKSKVTSKFLDLNKWKDKSAFNEAIKEHLREKRCLIPTEFEVPIIYI